MKQHFCQLCGKELIPYHNGKKYCGPQTDKTSCYYKVLKERMKINGRKYRVKVFKTRQVRHSYIEYLQEQAKREGKPFKMPKLDTFR